MLTVLFAISESGIVAPENPNDPLPWSKTLAGKADMKRFQALTMNSDALIVGRKTWESIPVDKTTGKRLPYRRCMIISRQKTESKSDEERYESVQQCITQIRTENLKRVYFIGGLNLLESMKEYITYYDITIIPEPKDKPYSGVKSEFLLKTYEENMFLMNRRFNNSNEKRFFIRDEDQILRLIARAIQQPGRMDRTGVGSHQIFGEHISFDLTRGKFPLITHRKSFMRGMFEELMWFIRGQTNVQLLRDKKVHIWDGNTTAEYLKSRRLEKYEPHTLAGPIYGWQWRNFGGEYFPEDSSSDQKSVSADGADQLGFIVREIKKRSNSRRLVMSAWNPRQEPDMCLPPCHILYQFHIEKVNPESGTDSDDYFLDCHYYQRSSDMTLALGWNIASASLLTYLIAKATGCQPRRLYASLGNCHVYSNHLEQARLIAGLPTFDPPRIEISEPAKCDDNADPVKILESFEWGDIKIHEYKHGPTIKMPMN